MMVSILTIFYLLSFIIAFDCSAPELDRYDFKSIKGNHQVSISKDTPPSKTETVWNIGICAPISDVSECKDADLCGVTHVEVDGTKYLTQVIKPKADADKVTIKTIKNSGEDNSESGVLVSFDKFSWGDATIEADLKFICPSDSEKEPVDKFTVSSWNEKKLELKMITKAACAHKKLEKKPEKKPTSNESGESWGWFTWIFIFFVLFLSIYIIGGAWFQYNKGNSIDFQTALKEVVENFIEVLKGLPIFIREIIEKFTGNSNRGEYSAV